MTHKRKHGGGDDLGDDFIGGIGTHGNGNGEQDDDSDIDLDAVDATPTTIRDPQRNRRKREKRKAKIAVKKGMDDVAGASRYGTVAEQCAFFGRVYRKVLSAELSELELLDHVIPQSAFVVSGAAPDAGTSRSLSGLPIRIKNAIGDDWRDVLMGSSTIDGAADDRRGAPIVIIVSASAVRANDITKTLSPVFGSSRCPVAKMFAKHLKVSDQMALLKEKDVRVMAGTPARLRKLADDSLNPVPRGLILDRLRLLVIDLHRDVKGYDIFSLPELAKDLIEFVRIYLLTRLRNKDLRIMLY